MSFGSPPTSLCSGHQSEVAEPALLGDPDGAGVPRLDEQLDPIDPRQRPGEAEQRPQRLRGGAVAATAWGDHVSGRRREVAVDPQARAADRLVGVPIGDRERIAQLRRSAADAGAADRPALGLGERRRHSADQRHVRIGRELRNQLKIIVAIGPQPHRPVAPATGRASARRTSDLRPGEDDQTRLSRK